MSNNGVVKISKGVIVNIVARAALDIEGVNRIIGFNPKLKVQEYIQSDNKGIELESKNNELYVNLSVIVDYSYEIPEVCKNIQDNIEKEVKEMTGLDTKEINIGVLDIVN